MGQWLKRGQATLEFVSIIGVLLFLFVVAATVMVFELRSAQEQQERRLLDQTLLLLREEIILASSVSDGFTRTFTLPETINGAPYTITLAGTRVVLATASFESDAPIPPINGTITAGENVIRKAGGVVCLNTAGCPP